MDKLNINLILNRKESEKIFIETLKNFVPIKCEFM